MSVSIGAETNAGEKGLQAILSSTSAFLEGGDGVTPHHPVTCDGSLRYSDDGCLACDHAVAPAEDRRTKLCLHYSVALLLIELVNDL